MPLLKGVGHLVSFKENALDGRLDWASLVGTKWILPSLFLLLDIFGTDPLMVSKGQLAGSCYRKGVGNKGKEGR